jgi:hypothetical protein
MLGADDGRFVSPVVWRATRAQRGQVLKPFRSQSGTAHFRPFLTVWAHQTSHVAPAVVSENLTSS